MLLKKGLLLSGALLISPTRIKQFIITTMKRRFESFPYLLLGGWIICSGCFISRNSGSNSEDTQNHSSYIVDSIPLPQGLVGDVGAIDFLPDGRLVACFLRGEVMLYNPRERKWKLFADGLQEPLGILPVSESEYLVMQRPELTRIKDTNGDGLADLYETVTDDFGISGNYHEFNYGPLKDKKGNLFIGLNSASSGGGIFKEVRGKLDTTTMGFKGQMFSSVPYRGWIMKLTPEGKLLPYASGFRSPNGMGFDPSGNLFVTENQGDWVGTSALYHVQEGKFYGHPSSLIWTKSWTAGNPLTLPIAKLDSMRTKASVLFPHGIMANSPTQPLYENTKGKFGPFSGQFMVGEMNSERIVRVMLEEVGGALQGACIPFIDGKGLRKGNNRLAFAPDGSLWVGQAEHGWAGSRGIQRIVFTGKQPMEILNMSLTYKGFDLNFTKPVSKKLAINAATFKIRRYNYEYHKIYGSQQFNIKEIPVNKVRFSRDRKHVSLDLESLDPGYIYELTVGNVQSDTGEMLENKLICYTLNKLKGP